MEHHEQEVFTGDAWAGVADGVTRIEPSVNGPA
jgi:hypothetical protein